MEQDVVINMSHKEDSWYDKVQEYVISKEYIRKMDEAYEARLRNYFFYAQWIQYECDISDCIRECEKAINIVNRRIRNATKDGRKEKTIERYKRDRVRFGQNLERLFEVKQIYVDLGEKIANKDVTYGYIEGKYSVFFMYNGKKYAFTDNDKGNSRCELLEVGEEVIDLLEGYRFYGRYRY